MKNNILLIITVIVIIIAICIVVFMPKKKEESNKKAETTASTNTNSTINEIESNNVRNTTSEQAKTINASINNDGDVEIALDDLDSSNATLYVMGHQKHILYKKMAN